MIERTTLRKIPLFIELDGSELDKIIESVSRLEFTAGEMIIKEGEDLDGMFALLSGKVQVSKHALQGEAFLTTLHPYAVFGEMSMLTRQKRNASVTALTDIVLLKIEANRFLELLAAGEVAAYKMVLSISRTLATRLRVMDERLTQLVARGPVPETFNQMRNLTRKMLEGWQD